MRRLYRPVCPNPEALRVNYKNPENKKALEQASNGKCMYCESQVSHVYYGDVEHIRPEATAKYPHLEFEWTNLGYCCARCNNAKKDQFEESCPIIDPYTDEPSEHFIAFGSLIRHKTGSERGVLTIKTVDLNRAELVERRSMKLSSLESAVDACYRTRNSNVRDTLLASLSEEGNPEREFSMFAKAFLDAHEIEASQVET